MSCIAGVGGDVPALVRVATDAAARHRPILAIDGCVLNCVRSALARHGVQPTRHLALADLGVRKRQHADFAPDEAQAVLVHCRMLVQELMAASGDVAAA